MAIRDLTVTQAGPMFTAKWTGLLNGDVGTPFEYGRFRDRSVQVFGTFGAGGSCAIEGSLDGGTTWAVLNDGQGNALAITAAKIEGIAEAVLLLRPHVTAGDGTTNLTVYVVAFG